MEPNNNQAPSQDPLTGGAATGPEIPQPLNTAGPMMGGTSGITSPVSGLGAIPPGGGLPPQLPVNSEVSSSSGGSKKMMVIIIIILILAILGVGGYYFYMQYSKGNNAAPTNNAQNNQTAQDLSGLQTEVDSIQITDPSADLTEIDSQINLLEATPASSAAKTTF